MNYIKLQKQLRYKHSLTFTEQVDRVFKKVNKKAYQQKLKSGLIENTKITTCLSDYQYLCE